MSSTGDISFLVARPPSHQYEEDDLDEVSKLPFFLQIFYFQKKKRNGTSSP